MRSEKAVSQTFTTCKVIDMVDLEVKKNEYNNRGYPNMDMGKSRFTHKFQSSYKNG